MMKIIREEKMERTETSMNYGTYATLEEEKINQFSQRQG
jgi:hypothetical protein